MPNILSSLASLLAYLPHMPAWCAIAFLPLLTFLDRDIGQANAPLRRSIAIAIAVLVGGFIGGAVFGPWFMLTGVFWSLWRCSGYGGAMDPFGAGQVATCAARYASWALMAGLAQLSGVDWRVPAAIFLAFGAIGLALRIRFGQEAHAAVAAKTALAGDPEADIERAEGAAFGAALVTYAAWLALVVTPG